MLAIEGLICSILSFITATSLCILASLFHIIALDPNIAAVTVNMPASAMSNNDQYLSLISMLINITHEAK